MWDMAPLPPLFYKPEVTIAVLLKGSFTCIYHIHIYVYTYTLHYIHIYNSFQYLSLKKNKLRNLYKIERFMLI